MTHVSIPRSEFWSFGPRSSAPALAPAARFNSSVGILVVRTRRRHLVHRRSISVSIPRSEFWSFGRAGFDGRGFGDASFNSSVGILVVRTSAARHWEERPTGRFNSSVGILVVRTRATPSPNVKLGRFQFLGRNSGRSDQTSQRQ